MRRQQNKVTWLQTAIFSASLSAFGFLCVRAVDLYRDNAINTSQLSDIHMRLGALEARKCP